MYVEYHYKERHVHTLLELSEITSFVLLHFPIAKKTGRNALKWEDYDYRVATHGKSHYKIPAISGISKRTKASTRKRGIERRKTQGPQPLFRCGWHSANRSESKKC